MPQQLQDIMAQLDPVYNPQKQAVQSQINALPGQQQAAQAGLDAAKTQGFSDINTGANSKGMYYSGMPMEEQAKYLGSTYLPAVANLKNTYADKTSALQQSLLGLTADQTKQAQNVYASESNAEAQAAAQVQAEQIKANAAARAAQQNGLDMSALLGGGQQQQQQPFQLSSDPKQAVGQLFQGYQTGQHPYYTENTVIPKLTNMFLASGPYTKSYAMTLAKNLAYNYRKQNFGE